MAETDSSEAKRGPLKEHGGMQPAGEKGGKSRRKRKKAQIERRKYVSFILWYVLIIQPVTDGYCIHPSIIHPSHLANLMRETT